MYADREGGMCFFDAFVSAVDKYNDYLRTAPANGFKLAIAGVLDTIRNVRWRFWCL